MQTQPHTADAGTGACGTWTSRSGSVVGPDALDASCAPAAAIDAWHASRIADIFPYEAVVAEFHRVGKHHVATGVLEALAGVRAVLAETRGPVASVLQLDRFLDAALDKWDGRYANPTYLALRLLPLPDVNHPGQDIDAVGRRYDRLFVQLIADALRFETAAADRTTAMLPQMRPNAGITAKRCRLGLQAAAPAAGRLALDDGVEVADPIAGARRLWANLSASLSPGERRVLRLTMLPVSVIHDEYQFIRSLQAFEATFALAAVHLRAAVQALANGTAHLALQRIRAAGTALREAAPLFSLVATMQVDAFQAFRVYTEGASAIQSRNYKIVESLCRRPDPSRLDSAAYLSVPDVRQRVLAGQATLDDAFAAARGAGHLGQVDLNDLEQAMRELAAALLRWRRAHYRVAVRMLGERTGTGYTEGSPYLRAALAIPVFPSLAPDQDADDAAALDSERGDAIEPVRAPKVIGAPTHCPFTAGILSRTATETAGA